MAGNQNDSENSGCQIMPLMLFLLSPAKALDFESPLPAALAGLPRGAAPFAADTRELISVLRPLSPAQVSSLMDLSDKLGALNSARYAAFSTRHTATNSRPAALAFNGDVYGGLDARSLSAADLTWAQEHLCILSGLYGLLRPLDAIQPYRLEMGTRLATGRGESLYAFWGDKIARELNRRQRGPGAVVVNLASQEYAKAVDRRALKARVVDCVFEEPRAGGHQIISFMAKRARGLMARYATLGRVEQVEQLQRFDLEGYAFAPAASSADRYVFRRKTA